MSPNKFLKNLFVITGLFLIPLISLHARGGVHLIQGSDQNNFNQYRLKVVSKGTVKITNVKITAEKKGISVSGSVEKSFGYSLVFYKQNTQIDLVILNPAGDFITKLTADYFPVEIPASNRDKVGQSTFHFYVPQVPPRKSILKIIHNQPW